MKLFAVVVNVSISRTRPFTRCQIVVWLC